MSLPKRHWVPEFKAPAQSAPRLASPGDSPIESPARLLQGQIAPALLPSENTLKYPGVVRLALVFGVPVILWAGILHVFGVL